MSTAPVPASSLVDPSRRYTLSEYLALDEASDVRLEYRAGEVVAMAGGTTEHAAVGFNVAASLGPRLRGHRCRGFSNDQQIVIPNSPFRYYPDASVVCGPVVRPPGQPDSRAIVNPTLVVEVLSSTTEAYDRGEKMGQYLRLESLQEYVLVSQVAARVETFFRQPGGTWLYTPTDGIGAVARLRSLEIDLPLAEVYDGVTLPPPPPAG